MELNLRGVMEPLSTIQNILEEVSEWLSEIIYGTSINSQTISPPE